MHNLSNNVQISQVSSTSVEEVQGREDNLQRVTLTFLLVKEHWLVGLLQEKL